MQRKLVNDSTISKCQKHSVSHKRKLIATLLTANHAPEQIFWGEMRSFVFVVDGSLRTGVQDRNADVVYLSWATKVPACFEIERTEYSV